MNFSTCIYMAITLSFLALVPIVSSKNCDWAFMPVVGDKNGLHYCTDKVDTWTYPQADCKPQPSPKLPPAASKCRNTDYPNIKNGNCPTYMPSGSVKSTKPVGYFCNLMISRGANGSKDQYKEFYCETLTNVVVCTGNKGVRVDKNLPNGLH
ncbi:secreted protein [Melampsora americana]|nr:secreted protein [Melampsora americana]